MCSSKAARLDAAAASDDPQGTVRRHTGRKRSFVVLPGRLIGWKPLASTQSQSVVLRSHRVDVYAPRVMRRCARLIDKIGHEQTTARIEDAARRRRASLGLQTGKKGPPWLADFGICLA
jgi:hypothetical protein